MQLERTPQPGQIWQHYKGNDYRIILVTGEFNTLEHIFALPTTEAIHTETGDDVRICGELFPKPITFLGVGYEDDAQIIKDPHILYQRVDPEFPQVWARPLDVFLDILSTPYIKGFATGNYSRFTRIS